MMKNWRGIAAVVCTCSLGATNETIAQATSSGAQYAASPLLQIDRHRQSVVDGIVATWQDALLSKHGVNAGQAQAELRATLMGLRADRLLAASLAGSYATMAALVAESQAEDKAVARMAIKAIGDANADLSYTPVNPCRIVDTRATASGALVANTARTFDGYNASSFAGQGGTPSSCGIPNGIAVIAMNVYAVNPSNLGFIKVWPANAAEPAVSTVNYQPGIVAIATGAIVPVDSANSNQFIAKSPSAVDFIADVVGYFKAPSAPIPALSAAVANLNALVASLTARVDKLEGQITAADLVGTYRISGKQTELQGGSNTTISSYVFQGTVQLAANGTFTITTAPDNGNSLRFFTNPPSVADFVGAGGGTNVGTWSYSNGAVTLDGGLVLDVAAAGKVLVGVSFGHADRTDVLFVLSRL